MKHGFNLAGVRDYVKAARKQGQAMTKEKGDASGSRPLKQARISLMRSGTGSTRPARLRLLLLLLEHGIHWAGKAEGLTTKKYTYVVRSTPASCPTQLSRP
jgi:hypothetical protein